MEEICDCTEIMQEIVKCNSLEEKLDEAKSIIRDLLFHLGNTFIISYTSKEESISKAEQFLSEGKRNVRYKRPSKRVSCETF